MLAQMERLYPNDYSDGVLRVSEMQLLAQGVLLEQFVSVLHNQRNRRISMDVDGDS